MGKHVDMRDSTILKFQTATQAARQNIGNKTAAELESLDTLLVEMEGHAEAIKTLTKQIRHNKAFLQQLRGDCEKDFDGEDIVDRVLNKYRGAQRLIAVEEASEWAVELIRDMRGYGDKGHILEEAVDVDFTLMQMFTYYDMWHEWDPAMAKAEARLRERMENGTEE